MPEHEFELYLTFLSRFLRLKPRQRAEIADELRDHLEERLQELVQAGAPREEAVRQALEELGDAAVLATDFTSITSHRRRRLIMRWTVRSIVALTAVILLTFALWPVNNQIAPQPAGAQPETRAKTSSPKPRVDGVFATTEELLAATERKLGERLPNVDFKGVPVSDALDFIAEMTGTDILIDKKGLEDAGVTLDTPITLSIKNTAISARTALELVLEQGCNKQAGFTIREGLVYVVPQNQSMEVKVYNCRDLVSEGSAGMSGGRAPDAAMMGQMARRQGNAATLLGGGVGGMPPGAVAGGMGRGGASSAEGEALIETITLTVGSETWGTAGGQGAISEFKGLIVVRQTQAVHREVKLLLEKMRAAGKEQQALLPGAEAAPPGGGSLGPATEPGTSSRP